jgi:hypothetical protein
MGMVILINGYRVTWDKTIWRALHFFVIHSNQTSEVFKCDNVLFIFFDFCSCPVLSKTEKITETYFLIKEICKEQKTWRTFQKNPKLNVRM